jgi:DNA-binding MarR family transcriptional regulator
MNTRISGKIKMLSNLIKRNTSNLESIKELEEISETNGFIIGYIYKNNLLGINIYQKDIEKEFGITRSTASKVITLMEKKELIIRVSEENDARLKRLVLTNKAIVLNNKVISSLNQYDEQLLNGFNEEEIKNLLSYLERIKNNI